MKVIFLQTIPGVKKGQIKDVAEGYAQHFLLPKKIAKVLTENVMDDLNKVKERQNKKESKNTKEAQSKAGKISGIFLPIKTKASTNGTLYAAIEPAQVVEILNKQYKTEIKPDSVIFEKPIKNIGQHKVRIIFAPGIFAMISLVVSAE